MWTTARALCILLAFAAAAQADGISFTKLVDTGTPVPGGVGSYDELGVPGFDGSSVAFHGTDATGAPGIYSTHGGLSVVADRQTALPGGGQFDAFGLWPSISGGQVAFRGGATSPTTWGIYRAGATIEAIAVPGQTAPGGGGAFQLIDDRPAISNGNVAFEATVSGTPSLYAHRNGQLELIADAGTPVPGWPGGGTFQQFGRPAISGTNVAFAGVPAGAGYPAGVYVDDGTLGVVADVTMPDLPEPILDFGYDTAISGTNLVCRGYYDFGEYGVFKWTGDGLLAVATTETPMPNDPGPFELIGYRMSISGDNVAFHGAGGLTAGIYAEYEGALIAVIESGDLLDGSPVYELDFSSTALVGDQLAFWARTATGTGIYVATLPEPGTTWLLAVGLVSMARQAKRSGRRRLTTPAA